MSDLIDRQAAIDALNEEYHGMISDESMKIYKIIEWLGDLPSAQPDEQCDNCHYKHIWMTQRMNGNGFFGHGGATG